MSKSSTTTKKTAKKLRTKGQAPTTRKRLSRARLFPVHPGEILLDELRARKVTQMRFAAHIRVAPAYLSDIIKGRRGISAEMAYKIGYALGSGPELWANLQQNYELNLVDEKKFADIKVIAA